MAAQYVLDVEVLERCAESLMLSEGLEKALDDLFDDQEEELVMLNKNEHRLERKWREPLNLAYQYLQLYHQKYMLTGHTARQMDSSHQTHLSALSNYLEHRLGSEYAKAKALFEKGLVNRDHWAILFRPGAVVITIDSGQPVAYVSTSRPLIKNDVLQPQCWSWAFDGKFFRDITHLDVPWPSDSVMNVITDLQTYPLQYASGELEQELRIRGEAFWACRSRKYIKYDVPLEGMEV
jgi:hypothetical protein